VTLLDALYAFFQEHERCGDLDGGLDGDRVWDDLYVRRGDQQVCRR
jgi:hypothetical protein